MKKSSSGFGRAWTFVLALEVLAWSGLPSPAQTMVASSVYAGPQQLVALDGPRRLHLYCVGEGRPTVVFDAGSGNGMATWRHVQAEVAKFKATIGSRRCRAGATIRLSPAPDITSTSTGRRP